MTISTPRSSRFLTALPLALLLASCSDSKGEQCLDEDPPEVQGLPDTTLLRARVTVEELTDIDASGQTTVTASIRADLIDTTAAVQSPRQQSMAGGPGCYGLTGQPTTKCREGKTEPCTVERLDADQIEVIGLAGRETVALLRLAKGSYSLDNMHSPLFASGPLTVRITSRSAAGYFPSMEVQVPQPETLVLGEPLKGSSGKPLGGADLRIHWTAGTADLVAINAAPYPAAGSSDDLQCIVRDDGCTTLLQGDLATFDMRAGSQLKLQMIRDNTRVKSQGTAGLEAKAISRVQLILTR